MPNANPNITSLVETFARQIAAAVEASMAERLQAALAGAFRTPAKPTAERKVKQASPAVARARKLQGQYLGSLKSLTGADRAKVKQTAKDKGVGEAVKLALSLKKA
jgi:hypothetical protein